MTLGVYEITRMNEEPYGHVTDETVGYVVAETEEEATVLMEKAGYKDEDNWFVDRLGDCLGFKSNT